MCALQEDYLVDHSIIHYLLNPDGDFVTFYGKSYTPDGLAINMLEHAANWQKDHPDYMAGLASRVPITGGKEQLQKIAGAKPVAGAGKQQPQSVMGGGKIETDVVSVRKVA